ncbi:leucyl/phenylalanyl-tRNA--protein transferase [Elizabethkingia sp. JS20170427COW]|uniref:leucyl/phenylalanyl-tRNA--protein transferase n=1 Tax=Elizabethkingia sp. JS20170427COW TaxID=2583851 RepID=UPI001110F08F|nr:leucyl/phenylalanyl-tRNA--protein transferase [Elizabethkingia sp. JS20170427COW]QCX53161.1 leucyl/phenylalanyl-tRNA--protein transferase [Elizabethkingia sp. JS20170427COW]
MYRLHPDEISFPDPKKYHPEEGVIAIGGDLSVERVWFAYQLGIFPWFNEGEEILWWSPDPRFVLYPNELRVSKSMRKIMRDEVFRFTENQCFEEVVRSCKNVSRKGQRGTWITEEMVKVYQQLHLLGKAKSVEVWQGDALVGGFYGVDLGVVFCGESMFSKVSNASKAGFIHFVQKYQQQYQLIDCQTYTQYLESLGAKMIEKLKYLSYLEI